LNELKQRWSSGTRIDDLGRAPEIGHVEQPSRAE